MIAAPDVDHSAGTSGSAAGTPRNVRPAVEVAYVHDSTRLRRAIVKLALRIRRLDRRGQFVEVVDDQRDVPVSGEEALARRRQTLRQPLPVRARDHEVLIAEPYGNGDGDRGGSKPHSFMIAWSSS